MKPHVTIIILNWNGWKDTIECLESVVKIRYPNYTVIVADNGSNDNSIEIIKNYLKNNTKSKLITYNEDDIEKTIQNDTKIKKLNLNDLNRNIHLLKYRFNYGFAKGNNIAIKFSDSILNSDYVLLLNNDTIVDTIFLDQMVDFGEKNKDFGIIGPIILDYNKKNRIQSAGAYINWKKGKISLKCEGKNYTNTFNDPLYVDYVEGCALLIKKEVLQKVGHLKEHYFSYWEETDLCVRAKKLNYEIICLPQAKIWHKKSKTVKKTTGFYEYYIFRNMFFFMKENAKTLEYFNFLLYFFGKRIWVQTMILIYYKNLKGLLCFLKGVTHGLFQKSNINL